MTRGLTVASTLVICLDHPCLRSGAMSSFRMVSASRIFCGTVVLTLIGAISASAQTATGNISGSVEDASGARVPNAAVKLIHSGTQQVRTVKTNDRGEFLAP